MLLVKISNMMKRAHNIGEQILRLSLRLSLDLRFDMYNLFVCVISQDFSQYRYHIPEMYGIISKIKSVETKYTST